MRRERRRLGRNRLILACTFLLSLICISFRGGALSYGLFAMCLIVPGLSFAYLVYVFFTFRIYQEAGQKTIVKGQEIPYRFVLTNEFPLVDAQVHVDFYTETSRITQVPDRKSYTLFYKDSVTYETSLVGLMRGEYCVGIREVTVVDYLGLFRLRYHVPSPLKVLVQPRIPRLESLRCLSAPDQTRENDTASQKTEPDVLVRRYESGDSLRQVHWKLSARTGALQVRRETGLSAPALALYLDLRPGQGETALWEEDTRLECVLALGAYFAEQGMPYYFCIPGEEEIEKIYITSRTAFQALYEWICQIPFTGSREFLPWEIWEAGHVIWVTGRIGSTWITGVLEQLDPERALTMISVWKEPYPETSFSHHPRVTLIPVQPGAKPEEVL